MTESKFKIVLLQPQIPGNTGSIARTCVALNLELILIRPLGFDLSEKAVRRAGLDYFKYAKIKEYDSFDDFLNLEKPPADHLFFFSKSAEQTIYSARFIANCYLVFGSETLGIPSSVSATLSSFKERVFKLPIYSVKVRSLNLANVATAVAYETIRQLDF